MRLTLRTMLAYLDDILDPADAEDLGQKIEQSEFATGLVHRIRSATSRARLGVPTLDGKGMGLDPNTVAEYLDNALPPDRVPDFEKICLESDVHLAEVAACHQVLTLILGQPVDINPDVKRRMLAIGSAEGAAELAAERTAAASAAENQHPVRHDGAHAAAGPILASTDPLAEPVTHAKREPREVPDYLRAGRRSNLKTLVIAMVVAFLGCVLVLRALGPFDSHHPLARVFGTAPVVAEKPIGQPELGDTRPKPKAKKDASTGSSKTSNGATAEPTTPEETPGQAGSVTPSTGQVQSDKADMAKPIESPQPEAPGTSKAAVNASVDNATPEKPAATPAGAPAVAGPAPETMQGNEPGMPATKAVGSGPPPANPDEPVSPVMGETEAVVVGQLKPTTPSTLPQVLLGLNPQTGEWMRLAPPARLMSGAQLLVPPTFSPEIVLSRGVQVVFGGPSLVRPMTTSVTDEVGLAVSYCRAFLGTAGVDGARIHLDLAGRKGVVTFLDPTSELALEVKRYLPPGADPEQNSVQIVIQLFTTVGRIQWDDAVAGATPIDQGQVHVITDRAQTVAAGELPAWVRRDRLANVDRMAATALESSLSADRPVALCLKERSKDRKSEVRALAARFLAYLDVNDAAVLELADDLQRPFWAAEFDALRESISRGPESAVRVREALERLCGEQAPKLYRMLWGYSPQQFQGRDAEQLVKYLNEDSLYVRVMAFENLRRITKKTLLYRPEGNKERRKSSFRSWQDQLQNGEIVYATLPSPTLAVD